MTKRFCFGLGIWCVLWLGNCKNRGEESELVANPPARAIIGKAFDLEPSMLSTQNLNHSMSERRRYAWDLVKRVNRPVFIKGKDASYPTPLWHTWYDMDEFRDLLRLYLDYQKLYPARAAPEIADLAMGNFHGMRLDRYWLEKDGEELSRFDKLLAKINTPEDVHALNSVGQNISLFSPALIKHLLINHRSVRDCEQLLRARKNCLDGGFPKTAAVVKLTWMRKEAAVKVFDTSAKGLLNSLGTHKGEWQARAEKVSIATPTFASNVLEGATPSTQENFLVGFSVVAKEIPHWLWVTTWWDNHARQDFGADNPFQTQLSDAEKTDPAKKILSAFGAFKMCAVTDYQEGDTAILKGGNDPDLAKRTDLLSALKVAQKFTQTASWCSNPYIETTPTGAATNCIGCHQHSGPGRAAFEDSTSLFKERNDFPGDFIWAFAGFNRSFVGEIQRVIPE